MERLQKFWLAGVCHKKSGRNGDISLPLEILNFTSAFILLAGGMVLVVLLLLLEHFYFKFMRVNLRKWDHRGCCSLISLVAYVCWHATKCGAARICGTDRNGDNLQICGSVIKVGLGLGLRLQIYGTNCWRR